MDVSVRRFAPYAVLGLLLALATTPVAAQQTTGKIQGRVVDAQTGEPLAGAQVIIVGTGLSNLTNENGYYFILNIPAGVYDVQTRYIGYQLTTVQGQRILAGQTIDLDFQLSTEAIALEPITVEGEANPLVPRDQTLTKTVFTGAVIQAVPVENVRSIVTFSPGVVETGDRRGQVIRGGRPGEAAVYLDGVLIRNFNAGAQAEFGVQTAGLEEADVLLGGFGAEYGQAQSGVINLVSRGGGAALSGSVLFETDQIEIENSYGYSRLNAHVAGPLLGEKLGFSLALTGIGQEDARPTFMGSDVGSLTFNRASDGTPFSVPLGQTAFFAPTGQSQVVVVGTDTARLVDYAALGGLGDKKPWNNADEYNLNLTLRGDLGRTRYNVGGTLARVQRRFFEAEGTALAAFQFRPQGIRGRRDKSWLVRFGLEHQLFQSAERSASLRVNVGYGQDLFVQGFLGETLGDTLGVMLGDNYPMDGDFLGFTFGDFRFPFEDHYTLEAWMARFEQMKQNPALNYLTPFETLINPATGQPFTLNEATELFEARPSGDNPYGIQDYFGSGFNGFAWRKERTLSVRADVDFQANRTHRLGLGTEIYFKDIENIGSSSAFGTITSSVSNTSPTFQNVYEAEPVIAGFYAKDKIDLGEVVVEVGARLDMFDSDVLYPVVPGFVLPFTDAQGTTFNPEFVAQKTQWQFSPRLGVGFPVTENTQFRFSYGHFTQVPPLFLLFGGITQDLSKTNPNAVFGRPIDFGRTIGYEVGFTHSFDPQTVLDISGYTREKQGDVAFRTEVLDLPAAGQTTVRFLTDADFGYTRGFDGRLSRRFGEAFSAQVGYSYLISRSTGSDPNTFLTTIGRQTDPVTGDPLNPPQAALPTDFDQRHTLSASGVLVTPNDIFEESQFANAVLRDLRLSLAIQARSGLPYTRSRTNGATASILGPDPIWIEPMNASRLPWRYITNLRLGREVPVRGDKLQVFVDVRNLINHKSVLDVFSLTGSPTNPGSAWLGNVNVAVSDADIVIADLATATAQGQATNRERFCAVYAPSVCTVDGVLTRDEQQISAIRSFLDAGWGGAFGPGLWPAFFYGEPRQIRLGMEWSF